MSLLLPQALNGATLPSLPAYLHRLEPAFIGYVLSFFVIATWWRTHHRLFSSIVRYDPVIVRLNSFFLLVISITPFLVSVLFAYAPFDFSAGSTSSRLAVALYAAVQAVGGLALLGIWRHATGNRRLVRATLPQAWIEGAEDAQVLTVVVFVVSAGLAFLSPLVGELAWMFMILGRGGRLLRPRSARRTGPGKATAAPAPASSDLSPR